MSASLLNTTLLGKGKSFDDPLKQIDLRIPNDYRKRHMSVFGTTGCGKTRLAENVIEQDIRAGRSVVFIDPKNDQDISAKIIQTAFACGRQEDLMFINTAFPEYSALINPLSHWFISEELVAHCIAGIKEGKEPYFRNVGKEIASAVVSALNCIASERGGDPQPIMLNDIKKLISREGLESLHAQMDGLTSHESKEVKSDLEGVIATGQEYYSKVASSLRVALHELTTGNIGKIIGCTNENKFMERLEQGKPVILVCQLGSLIVHEAAFTLGKVILSMVQSFIGRAYSSRKKKANPPICIHIDEAQSVLHPGVEDLFAKAGSADCWVTCYCQSVNQIYATLGKDFGQSILSLTNTKIFMKVPDNETAMYVAEHFGTHNKLSPIIAPGGSITTREMEEDIVKPFDVIKLRPREFYMLTYADNKHTGRFKGITADVANTWLEVIYPDAPTG